MKKQSLFVKILLITLSLALAAFTTGCNGEDVSLESRESESKGELSDVDASEEESDFKENIDILTLEDLGRFKENKPSRVTFEDLKKVVDGVSDAFIHSKQITLPLKEEDYFTYEREYLTYAKPDSAHEDEFIVGVRLEGERIVKYWNPSRRGVFEDGKCSFPTGRADSASPFLPVNEAYDGLFEAVCIYMLYYSNPSQFQYEDVWGSGVPWVVDGVTTVYLCDSEAERETSDRIIYRHKKIYFESINEEGEKSRQLLLKEPSFSDESYSTAEEFVKAVSEERSLAKFTHTEDVLVVESKSGEYSLTEVNGEIGSYSFRFLNEEKDFTLRVGISIVREKNYESTTYFGTFPYGDNAFMFPKSYTVYNIDGKEYVVFENEGTPSGTYLSYFIDGYEIKISRGKTEGQTDSELNIFENLEEITEILNLIQISWAGIK